MVLSPFRLELVTTREERRPGVAQDIEDQDDERASDGDDGGFELPSVQVGRGCTYAVDLRHDRLESRHERPEDDTSEGQ